MVNGVLGIARSIRPGETQRFLIDFVLQRISQQPKLLIWRLLKSDIFKPSLNLRPLALTKTVCVTRIPLKRLMQDAYKDERRVTATIGEFRQFLAAETYRIPSDVRRHIRVAYPVRR